METILVTAAIVAVLAHSASLIRNVYELCNWCKRKRRGRQVKTFRKE